MAAQAARNHYGLEGDIVALSGERDRNFLLRPASGEAMVLKFSNPAEDEAAIAFQIALLQHIEREGPRLPAPRVRLTCNGTALASITDGLGANVALHAISLLPGVPAQGLPSSETLRRNIGHALGQTALALTAFRHPGAGRVLLWDIMQAPNLRVVLACVQDPARRRFIAAFLDRFEHDLMPRLRHLPSQVIHNDLSASNIMLASAQDPTVVGVLDFGDAVHAPRINDLAVAASYHLADSTAPLDPIAGMVAAYEGLVPIEAQERAALPDLILARLVIRTIINEWRSARFPDNRAYIQRNMRQAWALLDRFIAMPGNDNPKVAS